MGRHYGVLIPFCRERALGLDSPDECVIWPYRLRDGYGVADVNRRKRLAHRLVLEFAGQPQPSPELEVRHLCGVRACVNLTHLKWGTRSENQQDRFRLHGDSMVGERNPRARLTASDVAAIRQRLDSGGRHKAEALRYGVSRPNISMIATRRTWRTAEAGYQAMPS